MAIQLRESRMHVIRWILTTGWLLIIASLFYDPWSSALTEPDHPWSPLRLSEACVPVQDRCLGEQPYPLGTTLFWGAVVPSAIFILLVFGHELWRRICPLSFLSQIPRALGLQRQIAKLNPRTGERRPQLAKVPADSWLARHYSSVQFGWLFAGLCGRILFFNADRLVLAAWLLGTIAVAMVVGWLYGGKAWCQYFCPMAPVQSVFSAPSGLLGSKAHLSEQPITQSMCRTTLPDGSEQSACVACQQPCIDIDAERMYWARITTPAFAFERYGYVGLVLGYFLYYYLYTGSWGYYFSGIWVRQSDQLATLLSPGLFLFGQAIPIPRLVAVPLVLGLFTWLGVVVGRWIEAGARSRERRLAARTGAMPLPPEQLRHRIFVVATFLVFNFFFLFAGRPLLRLLPPWVQYLFDGALVAVSTLWVYKAWRRNPEIYSRENLASRFRKQLERLQLDVGRFLDGRTLGDLNAHEVYVLAKVLPGFSSEKRHEAYKGVVREALEEGYVSVATSLEVLQQMRRELGISDEEHEQLLEELGVEDPTLLDPANRRSLEDQVRLSGYRKSLDRLMRLQSRAQEQGDTKAIRSLRRRYGITAAEEEEILGGLSPQASAVQKAEVLLQRLPELIEAFRALQQPSLPEAPVVRALLSGHIRHREQLSLRAILWALATLQQDPVVPALVADLQRLSPLVLLELLEQEPWQERLPAEVLAALTQPGTGASCSLVVPLPVTLHHLDTLLQDRNPLIQASALFLIARLDGQKGQAQAAALRGGASAPLLASTAERLLAQGDTPPSLEACPELEKRVVLATCEAFRGLHLDTINALAEVSELRLYSAGALITETGDTCRELLLLIEGEALVHYRDGDPSADGPGTRQERFRPGQMLDELEVLTHSATENTITAAQEGTRLLAVPVDGFDALLDRDQDFAKRVLELETRQLQRFMGTLPAAVAG
ncbi:MAG: cyclic nucleotide-binding protein [Cyanobium sp.]|uniref:cyclic nucleotide-binding domain-containing protein n=1 Tax=Synechococcus sp. CS-1333 TaxID=2848638 RepID=UPI000DBC156D|nr:cyclic nucleotide-binding domain-containing protein [Synechococcus sp. CS-1333]MCT0211011.1 cyclic nucleotide-binding domain-containing protein [Synechococcus sp. CS-1333]PZV23121.1 MAG: cyclic nucleotide-binding protein [Cyanobium sp.]